MAAGFAMSPHGLFIYLPKRSLIFYLKCTCTIY